MEFARPIIPYSPCAANAVRDEPRSVLSCLFLPRIRATHKTANVVTLEFSDMEP